MSQSLSLKTYLARLAGWFNPSVLEYLLLATLGYSLLSQAKVLISRHLGLRIQMAVSSAALNP